ncbi:MAG: metal-dependent hydrolase [Actinobacteria bacterium]|nr:metal-dependent hydrolase [Actinomycetota bacterium]MBV8959291.1 metal-dependent hydrolase [Actinomycetota bacterium]MBV9255002.1 metal-dependent hydrolase [Actinomycetota bacterium]MBV9666251.1 metal-dependent hydrolase [Actinomycetota bacterium]MBV9935258.1 metal-dependent hydrolase [Actinomycetota bacterium]
MTQTSNAARKVPTRRISFEESLKALPKHFAEDGDLILSHVAASLSSVFPDGEDYFVRSVRHFRDQITDPELKRQVAGFIGQEAMHGREHRALNDRLDELGYPVKTAEKLTKKGLALRTKYAPAKANLATTAALEHFTATLAELVLSDETTRNQFGHPAMRDIFLWHALEESEHKAVAFDVYKAVGGTERMRVVTMNLMTVGFILGMAVQVIISLAMDRETYRRGKLRKSLRNLRKAPFLQKKVWRQLRDYNRPNFHPDDSDTNELVELWRKELFGENGSLNDKLVGTSAVA